MSLHSLSLHCVSMESLLLTNVCDSLEEHADAAVEVDAGTDGRAAELI